MAVEKKDGKDVKDDRSGKGRKTTETDGQADHGQSSSGYTRTVKMKASRRVPSRCHAADNKKVRQLCSW